MYSGGGAKGAANQMFPRPTFPAILVYIYKGRQLGRSCMSNLESITSFSTHLGLELLMC